jgi:hypothetical protein
MSKHYKISIVVATGKDIDQIVRCSKYVEKVEVFDINKKYISDYLLCACAWGIDITLNVLSNKYITMIHSNYEEMKIKFDWTYKPFKRVTHYVAVGKEARTSI